MLNRLIAILILVSTLTACKGKRNKVNVNGIDVNTKLIRWEKDLFAARTIDSAFIQYTDSVAPGFFSAFNRVVFAGFKKDSVANLKNFKNYFDSIGVFNMIDKRYGNFKQHKADLDRAFKHIKYYYPDFKEPNILTFVSGFNYKNILLDSMICIGLDLYLDDDVNYAEMADAFPEYRIQKLKPEYIVVDVMESVYSDMYPDKPENNTLLEKMIYNGKSAYFKEVMLRDTEHHLLLGMTKEDFEWCEDNQANIWRYFISDDLLYNNDFMRIRSYVNEGPFSAGMPEDAPANTGSFIGWKIIRHYVKRENLALPDVMKAEDAQQILTLSKYRP